MLLEQAPPGTAYGRAVHGETATWGPPEHLLATIVDALRAANWQRANAGLGRGRRPSPYPKPYPRPTSLVVPPDPHKTRLSPRQIYERIKARKAARAEEVNAHG